MKPKLKAMLLAGCALVAFAFAFFPPQAAKASLVELTTRPATGDTVYWNQLGTPSLTLTGPQSFTIDGIKGTVSSTGPVSLWQQCCIGITGNFYGDFAPGDIVLVSTFPGSINFMSSPLTITFKNAVQAVGAQIQDNGQGDVFTAQIQAFHHNQLLGTFTETGFSGAAGNNSDIFLGVEDTKDDITRVVYEILSNSSGVTQPVAINQMSVVVDPVVPIPAALPLFATGLGALGLLGWRRKRKNASAITPA